MKIQYIEWLDHCSYSSGWSTDTTDRVLLTCESVGFLIEEDKNKVVLAQSRGVQDPPAYADFMVIAKKLIKKRTTLRTLKG